jgi:integrase
MKNGSPWCCPLSARALELLKGIKPADAKPDDFIFPGDQGGPMAHDRLDFERRALGCIGTVHGMRSTFRDWAAERGFPGPWAEHQLAHGMKDETETEKAYLRTTMVEQRRGMMEQWAAHCATAPAENVLPFKVANAVA